jgi:chromosome segregation ATPase
LERDLQRSRYQNNNTHRSIKRFPKYSTPTSLSPVHPSRATAVERFQAELNDRDYQIIELKKRLCDNQNQPIDGTNSEIIHLRAQLEQAEKLANEYKAQLHTQTLKTSANNSRNHLSEIELEKIRARLQKRIEELEPLPELLKQAESKNDKLQKQNNELQKRLADQSTFFTQTPTNDRTKDNYHHQSPDEDHRTLQR